MKALFSTTKIVQHREKYLILKVSWLILYLAYDNQIMNLFLLFKNTRIFFSHSVGGVKQQFTGKVEAILKKMKPNV